MASALWSTVQRRDSERELVFAGRQFESAIQRYHERAQPGQRAWPQQLEDLLRDGRSLTTQRDLRRIYLDPLSGQPDWGLVRLADGGIVGVYSLSKRKPFDRKNVTPDFAVPSTVTYSRWRFIAPSARDLLAPAAAASAP